MASPLRMWLSLIATLAIVQSGPAGQDSASGPQQRGPRTTNVDPWPMERQDRFGHAKAISGPAVFVGPWISSTLSTGNAISHGPALGSDGIGYFGNWSTKTLYKFDWRTGQVLGTFANTIEFVVSTPALGNGDVFFRTEGGSGRLFAVNTTIMDYDWFTPVEPFSGSPTIGPGGDIVVASATGNCYRLTQAGSTVWQRSGLGAARNTVVFSKDDSKVIVANGNGVTALNYADGSVAWSTNLGSAPGGVGVSASGIIVTGRADAVINGLDPTTGHVLWSFTTLGPLPTAPAFDGDFAYLTGNDTRLYKMDALTGHRVWSFTSSNFIPSPPSVGHDGRVYFHNIDANLYCVGSDGSLIWSEGLGGQSRGPMSIGNDGTLYVCRTSETSAGDSGLAIVRQTPAIVSGRLIFNDFVGTPPASATFQLFLRGTTTLVATATAAIAPDGTFTVPFSPSFFSSGAGANGIYDVSVKVGTWLRKRVSADLNGGSATGLTFSLVNGDINGDNVVSLADFAALRAAFGSTSVSANWNPAADLNGDGAVSLADFAILRRNFGRTGDPP